MVATALNSLVTSVEQLVELISRWLLDVEDQKPAGAIKVGYPLEATEGILESADGSSSYAFFYCLVEAFFVLGLDLQRP